MTVFSFNIHAEVTEKSISLLSQQIVDHLSRDHDEFVLSEVIGSDIDKNEYLPIDLQIRPHSLIFENLSATERKQIKLLISQVLSPKGYLKLLTNLSIDNDLSKQSDRSTKHAIKFYGKPSTGSWGFKFEGYHLSLTFLLENHEFKFINFFIGQDIKMLNKTEFLPSALYNQEAQMGSDLMNGLSARQLGKTYLSMNAPNDIITNPKQSYRIQEKWGLPSKSLSKKQMPSFEYWVMQYLDLFNIQLIKRFIDEVKEHKFEELYFVWSGHLDISNKNFYYLIYNDRIIIEHSVRDNHIHSITRITF
ncbi:DUF3500 domain-containing protein [Marinicella litoralis]|nr:DUF3500 domain-containing protein [Marinicella litoralis]